MAVREREVMAGPAPDRLLTVREAGDVLGRSQASMYRAILRGEIVTVKVGGSRRVPTSCLNRYIAARIQEAEAEIASYAPRPAKATARPSHSITARRARACGPHRGKAKAAACPEK